MLILNTKWECTKHACWVLFFMAAEPGPCTLTKSEGWMPFICVTSEDSCASPGRTGSQMQAPGRLRQTCLACSPSSPTDTCSGSNTCSGWKMVASQRTSCTESSPQERDDLAIPPYATRIPARETWRHVTSTQQILRQRHLLVGDQVSSMVPFQQRKGERARGWERESASDRIFSLLPLHLPSQPCQLSCRSPIDLYSRTWRCSSTENHCLTRQKAAIITVFLFKYLLYAFLFHKNGCFAILNTLSSIAFGKKRFFKSAVYSTWCSIIHSLAEYTYICSFYDNYQ